MQERLTNTIARAHSRTAGEAQEWVRLMLSCVGRGGDGQRIRDEILHIMHRCAGGFVASMSLTQLQVSASAVSLSAGR